MRIFTDRSELQISNCRLHIEQHNMQSAICNMQLPGFRLTYRQPPHRADARAGQPKQQQGRAEQRLALIEKGAQGQRLLCACAIAQRQIGRRRLIGGQA